MYRYFSVYIWTRECLRICIHLFIYVWCDVNVLITRCKFIYNSISSVKFPNKTEEDKNQTCMDYGWQKRSWRLLLRLVLILMHFDTILSQLIIKIRCNVLTIDEYMCLKMTCFLPIYSVPQGKINVLFTCLVINTMLKSCSNIKPMHMWNVVSFWIIALNKFKTLIT